MSKGLHYHQTKGFKALRGEDYELRNCNFGLGLIGTETAHKFDRQTFGHFFQRWP